MFPLTPLYNTWFQASLSITVIPFHRPLVNSSVLPPGTENLDFSFLTWEKSSLLPYLTRPFPCKLTHLLTDEVTDTSAGLWGGREVCQNISVFSIAVEHTFIRATLWLKEGKDSPFFYSYPNCKIPQDIIPPSRQSVYIKWTLKWK